MPHVVIPYDDAGVGRSSGDVKRIDDDGGRREAVPGLCATRNYN